MYNLEFNDGSIVVQLCGTEIEDIYKTVPGGQLIELSNSKMKSELETHSGFLNRVSIYIFLYFKLIYI